MYIFGGAIDIQQPANWPEGVEFPAQSRVISAVFDSEHYQRNRTGMNWNILIQTDETSIPNQTRCVDIFNRYALPVDVYGLAKYYIRRSDGNVYERFDWRPAMQGSYAPDPNRDMQIVFGRSTERADFDDNIQQAITRLAFIRENPPANLAGLYNYAQDLAMIEIRLLQLLRRIARPDQ